MVLPRGGGGRGVSVAPPPLQACGQCLHGANHRKSDGNLAHLAVLLARAFPNLEFPVSNEIAEPIAEQNVLVEPKLAIG